MRLIQITLAILLFAGFTIFATLPALAQDRTGLVVVMDYSGSMWTRTGEKDPNNPSLDRPSPDDPNDTFTYSDRAEELVSRILDEKLDQNFKGVTRLVTFGDRRSGDCNDITLHDTLGDRFDSAMQSRITTLFKRLRPKGRTPLLKSIDVAVEESKKIILEDKAERVQIVIVTDMKDVCKGNVYVAQPGKDDYCTIGQAIQSMLGRANNLIAERRGIKEGIVLEYIVSINPTTQGTSGSGPLQWLRECIDLPNIQLLTPDEVDDLVDVIENITVAPVSLNVTAAPASMPDVFGRDVAMLPGGLQVTPVAGGVSEKYILESAGLLVGRPRGTEVGIVMTPAQGRVQQVSYSFDAEGDVAFELRLPRLRAGLVEASGAAADGQVTWRVTSTNNASHVHEITTDQAEVVFDLAAGNYLLEALRVEKPTVSMAVAVGRDDLYKILKTPLVVRPKFHTVSLRVRRGTPSLPLGPEPTILWLVTDQYGDRSLAEDTNSLQIEEGRTYSIGLAVNGVRVLERTLAASESLAPREIDASLAVPRLQAADVESGNWEIENLANGALHVEWSRELSVTLHPGRYRLARNGRDLCPVGSALELGYGDAILIEDVLGWSREDCR